MAQAEVENGFSPTRFVLSRHQHVVVCIDTKAIVCSSGGFRCELSNVNQSVVFGVGNTHAHQPGFASRACSFVVAPGVLGTIVLWQYRIRERRLRLADRRQRRLCFHTSGQLHGQALLMSYSRFEGGCPRVKTRVEMF